MSVIENSKIKIDMKNCSKCKQCVEDCVQFLFYFEKDELHIVDRFEKDCIECGHCEAVCPENIIKLKFHGNEMLEPISIREEMPSYDSLFNLSLKRRSTRRFKEKGIQKELIEKLLKIGKYSPTGANSENVHFTIVQDRGIVAAISKHITLRRINFLKTLEDPERRKTLQNLMTENEISDAVENIPRYKRRHEAIARGRDFWCWNGELLIIHGDKTLGGIVSNSALAAAHIILAAETLGLGSCSLGYLTYFINESQTIRELINLPKNHVVGYCLTIGFPDVKYRRIPARKPLRVQWF
jgi:nitroreductase/NAD-dependent dihydropyrimidine dehydrogenase PreA subunit